MVAVLLVASPLAAIETVFFLLGAPLLLLMGVWAAVSAFRILIPEAPLPVDRTARARRRGEAAPVRARDIVAEQRRCPAPAFPSGAESTSKATSIDEALWARRN